MNCVARARTSSDDDDDGNQNDDDDDDDADDDDDDGHAPASPCCDGLSTQTAAICGRRQLKTTLETDRRRACASILDAEVMVGDNPTGILTKIPTRNSQMSR